MVRHVTIKNLHGSRQKMALFVEDMPFVKFITALILINAVTLGLETDASMTSQFGGWL
jgi:hypothetical protein